MEGAEAASCCTSRSRLGSRPWPRAAQSRSVSRSGRYTMARRPPVGSSQAAAESTSSSVAVTSDRASPGRASAAAPEGREK